MGVVCLTFRTLGRQLALRKGLLLMISTLLVLLMLVSYSFMQYSVALQARLQATSEAELTHKEVQPSEIPIIIKRTVAKVTNSSEGKETSVDKVKVINKPPLKEEEIVTFIKDSDDEYLKLSGSEEECLFSSQAQETKPNINVLDVMDRLPYDNKDGGVWKQGYDITYNVESFKEEPLQVFVVPHSHNDPGWIKTFEAYYTAQTRNILNNIVEALAEDKRRRFIWAEISFFDLWWSEQREDRRNLVKKLISNGQLEIVTGGWVMNDEANTHYFAMLDQLMEGHLWLHDNVGDVKPVSGWAIDPFGYTPTMAYLLQRIGFHNMLIQRTHYAIKKYFSQQKQLEYLWRQNWDHSTSTDMLCHMMPFYSYDVPHTCGPDPKICCQFDFKRLQGGRVICPWRVSPKQITDSNKEERSMTLLDQYRKKAQLYRTNVLLIPLGDDFRYDTKKETQDQYTNYQKIFDYYDNHPELNVKAQFGTLTDYFTALRKATGVSGNAHPNGFPSLVGDFFTYNDREADYWSGYYTSRPFYKNLDRIVVDRLRAAEIIYSLAVSQSVVLPTGLDNKLTKARRSLGLFQHHDGITGTAKNHVVVDYGNKLLDAVNGADHVMATAAQALLLGNSQSKSTASNLIFNVDETRAQHDSLPKKTIISLSEDKQRVVYLYNSLTHKRQELISLLVDSPSASVYDSNSNPITCQVNPVMTSDGIASSKYELVFVAKMAPLSLTKYYIAGVAHQLTTVATLMCSGTRPSSSVFDTSTIGSESSFTLSTDHLVVTFDGSTGLLQSIRKHDSSDRIVNTNVDFVVYPSSKSGAYLFLPDGGPQSIVDKSTSYCVTKGSLLHRVQVTMEMIDHIVQIANSPGVDGQSVYIINTVDVRSQKNKELVMKLSTSISNGDRVFYTDLNGFQTVRRKTMDKLTPQGNFYPMPSYMFLQDRTSRVTLLSGQPLGVSSCETGVMEVVLDRRLSKDDNRGLGHGVMDNKVTLSSFRLLVEHRNFPDHNPTRELSYPSLMAHYTSSILVLPVHHFILKPNSPSATALAASYTGLKDQLPCDIHMLNLRSIFNSAHQEAALLLHRKGFDCGFSTKPLTCRLTNGQVPVKQIFTRPPSSSVRTTLTMMYPVEDTSDHIDPMEIITNRLSWKY